MQVMAKFITFEGIEGVGKTTAIAHAFDYLQRKSIPVVLTREPGGTPLAEKIRQLLLFPDVEETMSAHTELLLMFASRVQHVEAFIKPHLKAGTFVLSDRFIDASFAYQGGGRGIAHSDISLLEHWINISPCRTILLDAPVDVAIARMSDRSAVDRIEQENPDFFARVRDAYLKRAALHAERFRVIDAKNNLTHVFRAVERVIDECIG